MFGNVRECSGKRGGGRFPNVFVRECSEKRGGGRPRTAPNIPEHSRTFPNIPERGRERPRMEMLEQTGECSGMVNNGQEWLGMFGKTEAGWAAPGQP